MTFKVNETHFIDTNVKDEDELHEKISRGDILLDEHSFDEWYIQKSGDTAYLLVIHGDVEPELIGPMNEKERHELAKQKRKEDPGCKNGLFRLDMPLNKLFVAPFSGAELDDEN